MRSSTPEKIKPKFLKEILPIPLMLIFCLLIILSIYVGKELYIEELHEGDVSLKTIYAPYDFSYQGPIDEVKTEEVRQEAMNRIRHIYDYNPRIAQEAIQSLDSFFKKVLEAQKILEADRFELLKAKSPIPLSNGHLKTFLKTDKLAQIKEELKSGIETVISNPILQSQDKEALISLNKTKIMVRNIEDNLEEEMAISNLLTVEDAQNQIDAFLSPLLAGDRRLKVAFAEVLRGLLKPNLTFNETQTNRRRQKAYSEAPIQYERVEVKRDELIIAKGQLIDKEHLLKLNAMAKEPTGRERLLYLSGISLVVIICIFLAMLYIKFRQPKLLLDIRVILLLGLLLVLMCFIGRIVIFSPLPTYSIPFSFVPMAMILLLNNLEVAFVIAVVLSVFIGILAGNPNVGLVFMIGGVAGICAVWRTRRRAQLIKAGLLVGLVQFIFIAAIGLLNNLQPQIFLKEGAWGIGSGVVSAFMVAGILPVLEYIFGLITDISLLELSDLNHPLLKKLALLAPGSYHHSLLVGNLAESACEAIGANPLLARVGSYYHDIGKMEKPEYFSENQTSGNSKHEKLSPSMSRLIVTNHVKEGVELARKSKLNKSIVDFIEQHHGKSIVFYFYQRALEKPEFNRQIQEEFRYPGPKPQTKEIAVVLLADSVEAASRSLEEPIPSRIKGLVRKIINNKFIDGQLDDCELTLKDLEKIAEIFNRVLTGIFHVRVEYPEAKDEDKRAESSRTNADKSSRNKKDSLKGSQP